MDFSINDNDKIGIVGVNGTGKSTLLKVVAGIEKADCGIISAGNNVKLRYLPQNPVFDEGATILEAVLKDNVDKGNEWTMESEAKARINRLGLPSYDTQADTLSGGEKRRLYLLRILMEAPNVLVYPIWWGQAPRIIHTFLESYDFSGKILVPFCTSHRSVFGSSAEEL